MWWLSAGFLMRDGQPVMTVTLMGGDMQAQGHAQLLVNAIDLGANVQAAADMARFRHSQVPNVLSLESSIYETEVARISGRMGRRSGGDRPRLRPSESRDASGLNSIPQQYDP